jgi:hypothetical protein
VLEGDGNGFGTVSLGVELGVGLELGLGVKSEGGELAVVCGARRTLAL